MSHFVGIAFIPRDDDYEVNENYSKAEQTLENMFSMGEALRSQYLTDLLAPYNEQDEDYCEVSPELNDLATDYLQSYYNKDYVKLSAISGEHLETERKWRERTTKWNSETKESTSLSLAEIDQELEPLLMLHRLMNPSMTEEMFDINNKAHKELFVQVCVDTDDYTINEDYQVFNHYFYNDEGYWDWYEVGGRWDNFFEQDNSNNVLEDISLLKGTRMVKRLHTLDWYETINLKDEDIKNRNLDNQLVKSWKVDEFGKRIEETYKDDEGNERTKFVADEYWTTEELLDEEVEIRKYNFLSMITEKYGWEQESRMGWFGISEKDNMETDDKEYTENSWDKLIDERIDELLKDVDDNGVCKWVAVAVDFHI